MRSLMTDELLTVVTVVVDMVSEQGTMLPLLIIAQQLIWIVLDSFCL